ncbi:topoisomerase DNA-binding C4 zinc finger domain-containing protein [Stutzerimonas xanthomarina]|uniref:topoisomerase DNA-binding C4 zinc finger domain-containing protein n=1 Tax=Stutzerimonas xanthomarina TaxID=271420 RepID=UPI003AA97795
MIKEVFKSALKNFQLLLIAWVIIIIANQLFIFGACFAPYCLMAALPHTFVIALLVNYFFLANESSPSEKSIIKDKYKDYKFTKPKIEVQDGDFEEVQTPYCPKCGSLMVLRIAKSGPYSGKEFWGCSKYPNCKGLLNI